MSKFCFKCKLNREVACFSKDKTRSDGLRHWCKSCKHENYLRLRCTRPSVTEGVKTCSKCKETKHVSLFARSPINKDGRQSHCRACNNIISSKWKRDNQDRHREHRLKYSRSEDGKLIRKLTDQDRRFRERGYR